MSFIADVITKDFKRKTLYEFMQESKEKTIAERMLYLEEKLKFITKCPEHKHSDLHVSLARFKSDLKKKWEKASRKEDRFLATNEEWLNGSISLTMWEIVTPKAGRPPKEFSDLSERSKRRKTQDLREQGSLDELMYAAQMKQRSEGNLDLCKIMKDVTLTPTRASKYRKVMSSSQKCNVKKHSPSQALSIFVEANLTRRQYEVIQSANKNIYPCYSLIQTAKKQCYPKEEAILVTDVCAEIKLQALLDHTCERLCKYLEEVLDTCSETENELELLCKWGCDGSHQSEYKQKFQNDVPSSDSHIFQSSFVPLRLIANSGNKKKILWQNPVPSSTRYCRPIRIRFLHESNDITNEEINYIESQASNLNKTNIKTSSGSTFQISHTLVPTMVDGKVCLAATNTTSTMRCYICGETSRNFNKLENLKEVNPDALKFGLSVLHARIRCFEAFLHLSYKLPVKKWQIRSAEEKKIIAETKQKIQEAFKEELGLLVDIPKAGFGNTNDGNTSRRFFENPEISSQITGINVRLILRVKVILEAITSGHAINVEKFASYARETAELYVELYGWYPMSPTLHKILMHGAIVISHAILPIGQLSEEAAEARNKHFRLYRQNFTRKITRKDTNRDILNRLLLTSDPYISSIRNKRQKKSKPFMAETLNLLVSELPAHLDDNDSGSSDDEDEIPNMEVSSDED